MPDRDPIGFPQDWGTGLQETVDWNDAGAFAYHMGHPNLRGYVADGFEFDVDWANNLLNVSEGKAFLWEPVTETNDHRADDGPDAKELHGALFAVQRGPSGDINLATSERNYIYVALNQQNNDQVEFYSNTTETEPPAPYLRLGVVDTFDESVYPENRAPSTTTNRLRVTGPTYGTEDP